MTEITLKWNEISQVEWDSLLKKAEKCSFQQAWAYGAVLEHGAIETGRFVASDDNGVLAMGQIITRRFFGLFKFALLLKGPLWLRDVSGEQKHAIHGAIRQYFPLKYFSLFAFSPEIYDDGKKMGYHQIITGDSTILIDLTQSEEQLWQNLYSKNRTHIRKARKNNFKVIYGDHTHPHTPWLLAREKKQQSRKKYHGLPVQLVNGYGQNSLQQGVRTAFACGGGQEEPMAGALFLLHGRCATYHIGWNGSEGRKCRALNLLLWEMMLRLKEDGVDILDLGGVNTETGADIARYKLSFGGNVITSSGTYM